MGDLEVTSAVASAPAISATVGTPGNAKATIEASTGDAVGAEVEKGSITTRVGLGGEAPEEDLEDNLDEAGEEVPEEGDPEGDASEEDEAGEEEDLGDYDPTDEAKISKFDARYTREDGTLDVHGKLSAEFWGNEAKGTDGLNESTYAYLRDRFGIDKETVKDIEAAQKAARSAAQNEVASRFGGKENFDAAMKWAREGGYTKAQRDRFNAITRANDHEAMDEALTALEARWKKATGAGQKTPEPEPSRVRPRRDVTSSASRTGRSAEPYATQDDWAKAFREADKDNPTQMAEIRRRMKASDWWKASRGAR